MAQGSELLIRLYPLTHEAATVKGLLPLANKPMIYYPLQWLEKGPFNEVIIAAYPESKPKISHYVHEVYESQMKIQVVEVPEGSGSADALRAIKAFIKVSILSVD
jgi:translation initiation factor eIF-2B subunit gamma